LIPNNNERRNKFSVRVLIIALIAALFFGYAIFARLNNNGSNQFQINIMVPWGLIAVFISFYLFKEFNRVKRAKREERRENLNERRQELLDNVLKKNKHTETNND
jgi:high-affinity Fe2+/Pb2+ permease